MKRSKQLIQELSGFVSNTGDAYEDYEFTHSKF